MSKPSKRVLAERVAGVEALREQQERWERDRRIEDRTDRAKKDEELNGVRIQLHEQASSFATKDYVGVIERSLDSKIDALEKSLLGKIETEFQHLNETGTVGFREDEAERQGREDATREILASSRANQESAAANRRWLIGIIITVVLGLLANGIALLFHILNELPH